MEGFNFPKNKSSTSEDRKDVLRDNEGCANIAKGKIKGAPEPDTCLFTEKTLKTLKTTVLSNVSLYVQA